MYDSYYRDFFQNKKRHKIGETPKHCTIHVLVRFDYQLTDTTGGKHA